LAVIVGVCRYLIYSAVTLEKPRGTVGCKYDS